MSPDMTPSPEQTHAETILIIDNDLGFLMWLGLSLASRGYLTMPATSCQNALRLVDELQPPTIDLVMINPALPGASDLISVLRSQRGSLKVMSIEDQVRAPQSRSESEWLSTVLKILGEPGA
jgi:ActR/RegA family two-component response regulator